MKLQETLNKYYKLSAALKETIKQDLKVEFDELFAKSDIKAVQWSQYTPYFNDGDECEFSVNEFSYLFIDINELKKPLYQCYGIERSADNSVFALVGDIPMPFSASSNSYHTNAYNEYVDALGKEKADLIINFNQIMKSIPSEVMHDIYGNHALVTVTATGTEIEEYEHD